MSQKETKHYMTKVNLEMLPPDEECKKKCNSRKHWSILWKKGSFPIL